MVVSIGIGGSVEGSDVSFFFLAVAIWGFWLY